MRSNSESTSREFVPFQAPGGENEERQRENILPVLKTNFAINRVFKKMMVICHVSVYLLTMP